MAFPSEGITFDGDPGHLYTTDKRKGAGRTKLSSILDGTSNSLLVGSVSPGRKIPWSKPEDVVIAGEASVPGKDDKKGFAAPYESTRGKAGVFLFADGSVQTITGDVKPKEWNALLAIADGIPVDRGAIPGIDPSFGRATMPVFRIVKGAKGVVAEFSLEEVAMPDAYFGAPTIESAVEEIPFEAPIAEPFDAAPKAPTP